MCKSPKVFPKDEENKRWHFKTKQTYHIPLKSESPTEWWSHVWWGRETQCGNDLSKLLGFMQLSSLKHFKPNLADNPFVQTSCWQTVLLYRWQAEWICKLLWFRDDTHAHPHTHTLPAGVTVPVCHMESVTTPQLSTGVERIRLLIKAVGFRNGNVPIWPPGPLFPVDFLCKYWSD